MNKYSAKMQELGALQLGIHSGYSVQRIPEEVLAQTEITLGYQLPDDYREFVRDYGGYVVRYPLFRFDRHGEEDIMDVDTFFGVTQSDYLQSFDILHRRRSMLENIEEWKEEWLPIASAGSCLLALVVGGNKVGEVLFFDNSSGEHFHVANSFDDFMQILAIENE